MDIRQIDIAAPIGSVEVQIKDDGSVLWVNVEGICVLRICRIGQLIIEDARRKDG